jgi:hypothetical protein
MLHTLIGVCLVALLCYKAVRRRSYSVLFYYSEFAFWPVAMYFLLGGAEGAGGVFWEVAFAASWSVVIGYWGFVFAWASAPVRALWQEVDVHLVPVLLVMLELCLNRPDYDIGFVRLLCAVCSWLWLMLTV